MEYIIYILLSFAVFIVYYNESKYRILLKKSLQRWVDPQEKGFDSELVAVGGSENLYVLQQIDQYHAGISYDIKNQSLDFCRQLMLLTSMLEIKMVISLWQQQHEGKIIEFKHCCI